HEFDGVSRRWNEPGYVEWIARGAGSAGRTDRGAGEESLNRNQAIAEQVYLSLRTSRGLALDSLEVPHVQRYVEAGWATLTDDGMFHLHGAGWLRLDSIATVLTTLRSR